MATLLGFGLPWELAEGRERYLEVWRPPESAQNGYQTGIGSSRWKTLEGGGGRGHRGERGREHGGQRGLEETVWWLNYSGLD